MCPHDAQRVASALDIIGLSVYTVRQQSASREHNEWPAYASLDMRCKHAGCALGVRWVCARCAPGRLYGRCSPDLNRRTYQVQRIPSVCSACAWRWSNALCACLASFWHVHPCVELRAHFCACPKIPTHTTHDKECIALVQRARRRLYE